MKSLFALLLSSCLVLGLEINGKVVSVADADTITVLEGTTQHKVRLNGIDAPERGQDYGTKATDAIKAILADKPVRVVVSGKDKYERLLGVVYVDQTNINEWLVENGWAWHYKKYSDDKKLSDLEIKAKAATIGLWADKNAPMPPWDYRASQKQTAAVKKGESVPLGYWLNSTSNVRHNSTCRYYSNTSKGRKCNADEGKTCGICGG